MLGKTVTVYIYPATVGASARSPGKCILSLFGSSPGQSLEPGTLEKSLASLVQTGGRRRQSL